MTDKYENMDPVALLEEVRKLDARINNPITDDFLKGVRHEAAHQVGRWGTAQDRGKTPLDWFWLIGFLAQKAATSAMLAEPDGVAPILDVEVADFLSGLPNAEYLEIADPDRTVLKKKLYRLLEVRQLMLSEHHAQRALHHTISTAAALLNWHAQLTGNPLVPESPGQTQRRET